MGDECLAIVRKSLFWCPTKTFWNIYSIQSNNLIYKMGGQQRRFLVSTKWTRFKKRFWIYALMLQTWCFSVDLEIKCRSNVILLSVDSLSRIIADPDLSHDLFNLFHSIHPILIRWEHWICNYWFCFCCISLLNIVISSLSLPLCMPRASAVNKVLFQKNMVLLKSLLFFPNFETHHQKCIYHL